MEPSSEKADGKFGASDDDYQGVSYELQESRDILQDIHSDIRDARQSIRELNACVADIEQCARRLAGFTGISTLATQFASSRDGIGVQKGGQGRAKSGTAQPTEDLRGQEVEVGGNDGGSLSTGGSDFQETKGRQKKRDMGLEL